MLALESISKLHIWGQFCIDYINVPVAAYKAVCNLKRKDIYITKTFHLTLTPQKYNKSNSISIFCLSRNRWVPNFIED